jgi:hypothetical protein
MQPFQGTGRLGIWIQGSSERHAERSNPSLNDETPLVFYAWHSFEGKGPERGFSAARTTRDIDESRAAEKIIKWTCYPGRARKTDERACPGLVWGDAVGVHGIISRKDVE